MAVLSKSNNGQRKRQKNSLKVMIGTVFADKINIVERQLIVHWQANQAILVAVAVWQRSTVVVRGIIGAPVQAQVVEHRQYSCGFEPGNEVTTFVEAVTNQIEHMSIIGSIIGNGGQFELARSGERSEPLAIVLPQSLTTGLNGTQLLYLGPEKGPPSPRTRGPLG